MRRSGLARLCPLPLLAHSGRLGLAAGGTDPSLAGEL
jgi:hypothetical protein